MIITKEIVTHNHRDCPFNGTHEWWMGPCDLTLRRSNVVGHLKHTRKFEWCMVMCESHIYLFQNCLD